MKASVWACPSDAPFDQSESVSMETMNIWSAAIQTKFAYSRRHFKTKPRAKRDPSETEKIKDRYGRQFWSSGRVA